MATITLTVPDDKLDQVVEALCQRGGWTAESGVARPLFARQQLYRFMREEVFKQRAIELRDANTAELNALQEALVTVDEPNT